MALRAVDDIIPHVNNSITKGFHLGNAFFQQVQRHPKGGSAPDAGKLCQLTDRKFQQL
jgi:hypothetical protein